MATRSKVLAVRGVVSEQEFERLLRLSADYLKLYRPRLLKAVQPAGKTTTLVASRLKGIHQRAV